MSAVSGRERVLHQSLQARVRSSTRLESRTGSAAPASCGSARRARNAALSGGLPEIALGFLLAAAGAAVAVERLGPAYRLASLAAFVVCAAAGIVAVVVGIRRVTGPRAGWAALDRGANGAHRVGWPSWGVALAAQVVTGILLLLWKGNLAGPGLTYIVRSTLPVLTAALVGSALAALAVVLRSARLFACTAVAGGAVVANEALGSPLPLLLTAGAVLLVGIVSLRRFARRYPLDGSRHADRRTARQTAAVTPAHARGFAADSPADGAVVPCTFDAGIEVS